MITLFKCEFLKTKRCFVLLTSLVITVLGLCWGLYGEYTDFILKNGWRLFLYQFPLINALFLPLLAIVVASRVCSIEHKGVMLKQLFCIVPPKKLYDAKLVFGLGIVFVCTLFMWLAMILFGKYKGFEGDIPLDLYLLYFLFTFTPTAVIYLLQHTLSLLFKNQAVAFFVGVLGEFIGVFSMFLPSIPFLRRILIWGYYGELQFINMLGWTKETRYENVYFDVLPINLRSFAVLLFIGLFIYVVGRYLFNKKEV